MGIKSLKKNNFLQTIFFIIPYIIILFLTGIIFGFIINIINGEFSFRLIKIAIINSSFLSIGLIVNQFIIRNALFKINNLILLLLSILFIIGVCFFGFLSAFISEPFFFVYETNLIYTYILINFIFTVALNIIISGFIVYQATIELKEKIISREKLLRERIEKKLYLSKINPHFLFNSLNLIISLLKKPDKAEEALLKLSDILRFNLNSSEKDYIDIDEELLYIEEYLFIQKLRFEERLDYKITKTVNMQIPPMIIQPLVENCIKHNINTIDFLMIEIEIFKEKNYNVITVYDSCRQLDESMIGNGTGLENTMNRVLLAEGIFKIHNGGIEIKFKYD